MIGKKLNKPVVGSEYATTAKWCNSNNATIEDKGDYYEVVALPEPTDEEKKQAVIAEYTQAIASWMNAKVAERGYDDVVSCISYENDDNATFAAEASAVKKWRSAVYTKGYALIDQYSEGDISAIPTVDEVIAMLPILEW